MIEKTMLNDSTFNLTEKEKRVLEKSWAKVFADKVFPAIDEKIFSVLYSEKASRPNTPVNVIIGALILKEALGDQSKYRDGAYLVADGAYSGEQNSAIAESHNLKLVTTNFTGRKPDEIYADFIFTDDGHYLIQCKNNCKPMECTYDSRNDRSVAYFETKACQSYPYKDICKPRFLKNKVRKEVSSTKPFLRCFVEDTRWIKFLHMENFEPVYILVLK